MLSLDPPSDKKDLSFAPLSSTTSTSTTNTEEEGSGTYKERKWIVNESNLMQLFTRCPQCGQTVNDTKKFSFGSLFRVSWECINGHEGSWNSCNETRGMADNNLLCGSVYSIHWCYLCRHRRLGCLPQCTNPAENHLLCDPVLVFNPCCRCFLQGATGKTT